MLPFAASFLLLSGLAALTYQVVWVRLLGLSMGSTAASVATVLAAFFGGLALGSALADRLARRRSSYAAYLTLEAVIGLAAVALFPLLLRLDLLVATVPSLGTSLGLKFAVTVALLSVPTVCMGATFPVMADLLARGRIDLGARLGLLYSLNTWGAVAGAGLGGFVFIPRLGLGGAVAVAAACNFGIVAVGLAVRSRFAGAGTPAGAGADALADTPEATYDPRAAHAALTALVATGFCSIAAEVGWTKYLSIFVGTTLYGFATILVVFLAGIALGSWLIRPLLGDAERSGRLLVYGLLALAAAVALTRPALSLAPMVVAATGDAPGASLWSYAFVAAVLAPPTLLLGALFPVSLELYCGGVTRLRRRAGRAYALNTLAGIAGSIAAGFWAIPVFGTDRLLAALAVGIAAAAAVAALVLGRAGPRRSGVVGALAVAAATVFLPPLDFDPLVRAVTFRDPATASEDPEGWRFEYLREARAGVISVITRDGVSGALQNNGLTESHIFLLDPTVGSQTESLLGLVPYLLHREPKDAFVVGFGGGNTAFALTRTRELERIRVVELEPAIVEAVRTVTRGFVPALVDPRVELAINDARNALLVENDDYDIIVSQPSHPWLAGSGTLFTREFFEIIRSRLRPGGVFGQWVSLFHMDAVTLGAILHSFYDVFPYGFALRPGAGQDLLVFGSMWPLVLDSDRTDRRLAHRELAEHLGRFGKRSVASFFEDFAISRTETLRAVQTGPVNTDTNLLSEVRLARIGGGFRAGGEVDRFLADNRGFDVIPHVARDAVEEVLAELASRLESHDRDDDAGIVRSRAAALPRPRRR